MQDKEFQKSYKKLNPAQKEAVDAVEGPVMVIAGPGTGKTTILTLRIANILRKTDADPDSILALTFTESAVYSIREKLLDIIGSEAYKVGIYTFHGFANSVISRHPDSFPRIVGSTHIMEIERIKIIEEVIKEARVDLIRPYGNPYFYVKPVLRSIQDLKRDNISPEAFRKFIKNEEKAFKGRDDIHHTKGRFKGKMRTEAAKELRSIEKNKELLLAYEAYENILRERNLYDFEDMILEVVRVLEKDEPLLRSLQEKYQYVLADEHQDANFSQNRLLELLSSYHDSPNLFIVGDEKQAIFRFQGASLENFLYFRKTFPGARLISLVRNYRSTQTILDAAHSLISKAELGEGVPRERLLSQSGNNEEKISIFEFSAPQVEKNFIAKEIKKIIKDGANPEEIAVLYRDNKDAFSVADIFEREKIPFIIESSVDILSDEDILKIIGIFRAVADLSDEESLVSALYFDFLDLDPVSVHKLLRRSRDSKKNIMSLLRQGDDKEKELSKKLSSWSLVFHNKSALDAFEIMVRESGFLSYILKQPDSARKLAKLDRLLSEVRNASEGRSEFYMKDFMHYLDLLLRYDIKISGTEEAKPKNVVRLMTAHKSKGLEFDHVFIVDVSDGHWGNRRSVRHFNTNPYDPAGGPEIDDERRLFYVALTRARKRVYLTYSRSNEDGKKVLRSQFLEEIEENFLDDGNTGPIERATSKEITISKPKDRPAVSIDEKEYLNALFIERGLSVTSLNNYLSCPWTYFFENLVRIPKAPNKFQRYGTVIHDSLFFFFEDYKKGNKRNVSEVIEFFRGGLKRQTLSDREFKDLKKKGEMALKGYFKQYGGTWERNILNEFDVAGIVLDVGDEKILIKGKLDKIEILGDSSVRVVDYKTAKPLSRNAIEGKTKSSEGNYKRQLVFYKLLLDNFRKQSFNMTSGVIDFVEPDDKGKYRKEEFEITAGDVGELTEVIERSAKEILDLSFWNKRCGKKDCKYCALANAFSK